MDAENATYFDSFRVERAAKEIRENSLEIEILQRIFTEYKHMILSCVDILQLD